MKWSEAFRRSIVATLWMVLFFIVFGVVIGIGMILGVFDVMYGDGDYNFGLMILGVIIVIIGYIGILFASFAVYIKTFTDSVTDNIIKRLYPPSQQPLQQMPRQ
jgi:uncharacterized membrane protein